MDRSECNALGKKHLTPMLEFFSVDHWQVTFEMGRFEEGDTTATCTRNLPYDLATIKFDPEQVKDEDHFLDVLAHEVIHIVLAPFDLYRTHYCAAIESKSVEDRREDVLWANSVERTILNLERLWRRHMKALYLKSRGTDVVDQPESPAGGCPGPSA